MLRAGTDAGRRAGSRAPRAGRGTSVPSPGRAQHRCAPTTSVAGARWPTDGQDVLATPPGQSRGDQPQFVAYLMTYCSGAGPMAPDQSMQDPWPLMYTGPA